MYRAVDSTGETIDFMLSPKRDAVVARHLLQKALMRTCQIRPRVINVDGHKSYPPAVAELKTSGELGRRLPLPARGLSQQWNEIIVS